MEVICLEDEAFYSLVEQVFERLKSKEKAKDDLWISADEATKKLRISSCFSRVSQRPKDS